MLTIGSGLYIRHEDAKDVPFVEVDKETLEIKKEQSTYIGEDGGKVPLAWTTQNELTEEQKNNSEDGMRALVSCPMFHDGKLLYVLVPYVQMDSDGDSLHRLACEVYKTEKTNQEGQQQLTLMHNVKL